MCTYTTKNIQNNKKVENTRGSRRNIFQDFLTFIDSTEQQQYQDLKIIKEERCTIQERRKDIYSKDSIYG